MRKRYSLLILLISLFTTIEAQPVSKAKERKANWAVSAITLGGALQVCLLYKIC